MIDHQNHFICLVLAAGESKRYGENKLAETIPHGSVSIIENVIRSFRNSKVKDIVVVISPKYGDSIRKLLSGYHITFTTNPHPADGMSSSIKIGLKKIKYYIKRDNTISYVVVTPADFPHYSIQLMKKIFRVVLAKQPDIAVPSYKMKKGHPLIVHKKYIDDILKINEETLGLKGFIKKHTDQITYISVNNPGILKDIDYPSDLDK